MQNSTSLTRFLRHYAEMVAAMFAGMLVLGVPVEALMQAAGTSSSELQADAPAVALLGMATVMTIPMVGLMRWRGHGWRPCWEMAASMYLPTLVVIGVLAAGAVTDFDQLMVAEHMAMLPAMFAVMLLRYDEYAACGHHRVAA